MRPPVFPTQQLGVGNSARPVYGVYSDSPSNNRGYTQSSMGFSRRKSVANPLAMTAAARIYAQSLPKLLGAATNRGQSMSMEQAQNNALRLIYAGRIQGQTM